MGAGTAKTEIRRSGHHRMPIPKDIADDPTSVRVKTVTAGGVDNEIAELDPSPVSDGAIIRPPHRVAPTTREFRAPTRAPKTPGASGAYSRRNHHDDGIDGHHGREVGRMPL